MTPKQLEQLEKIEEAVCKQFNISTKRLYEKNRFLNNNTARAMIIHLSQNLNILPDHIMPRYNRKRANYYNTIYKVNDRIEFERDYRILYNHIKSECVCEHDMVEYKNAKGERVLICSKCDYLERL